jgi:hypothetical protein
MKFENGRIKSRSLEELGANSPERFGRRPDQTTQPTAPHTQSATKAAQKIINDLTRKK